MKLRVLLILMSGILLNSCYKFESLPKKMIASYEFAIPLIDTVIKLGDFKDISALDLSTLPPDSPINMGEIPCLFYLNKLSEQDVFEWLEPKIILEAGGISGAKINFQVYTYKGMAKNYFWLPETVPIDKDRIVIPETPSRITPNNDNQLQESERIYVNAVLYFPQNTVIKNLLSEKISLKIGIKIKMKNNLEVSI